MSNRSFFDKFGEFASSFEVLWITSEFYSSFVKYQNFIHFSQELDPVSHQNNPLLS